MKKNTIGETAHAIKTIVEIIRMVGSKDYGTDLRNQASHELCQRIVDSGVLDEAHLPFI